MRPPVALGVVLLFGLDLSGSSDQLLGGLMVLGASLCYAIGAMLFKHKLPGAPPVGVAAGQMAVAEQYARGAAEHAAHSIV